MARAGVVGQAEVEAPTTGTPFVIPKSPAFWTWFWFGVAVAIILGFHVRLLGVTIPPNPSAP